MIPRTKERRRPPRMAAWFLARTIEAEKRDSLLGDFEEFYNEVVAERSAASADAWYWNQLRKSFLRLIFNSFSWSLIMIRNYLTVSYRNCLKNKANSLITVLGLALGMACGMLIFFFARDEHGYDRFHQNIDRIYHLGLSLYRGDKKMFAEADPPLGPSLISKFPEIEESVRMTREWLIAKSGDKVFKEKGLAADPGFFRMFNFPLKDRVPPDVLEDPRAAILSEAAALRHFGLGSNPVGKTISLKVGERFETYRVAAVAERIPDNSSVRFDILVNIAGVHGKRLESWEPGLATATFLQLRAGADPEELAKKFPAAIDKLWAGKYDPRSGYRLEFLADYHLNSTHAVRVLEERSKDAYSRILTGIAFLILLIAFINFMNLSLGNSATRIKEIGVRKVLGAERKSLIRQFCLEAVTLSVAAVALSSVLARLFLPTFNALARKDLQLDFFGTGAPLLVLLALAVVSGLVSGFYPALILSGFDSMSLFRHRVRFTGKNAFSRAMIVLQFGIAIFMIVATLVMNRQNRHMLSEDVGYDTAQVIVVPLDDLAAEDKTSGSFFSVFKQNLSRHESIRGVAGSEMSMTEGWSGSLPGLKDGSREILLVNGVDQDFITLMGIKIVQGRGFSPDYPSDLTDAVVVNQAFIGRFGLTSPLGLEISSLFSDSQGLRGKIIGVTADFHHNSLRDKILPAVMTPAAPDGYGCALIKVEREGMRETLETIKKEFDGLEPGIPFSYAFLDDEVAAQYATEERWGKIVTSAAGLAILIACSGLFGLTMITVARRTKEIGVRRVLGASVFRIAFLINREFIALVLAANLIGWPAAYWGMNSFLRNYAYRIQLGPLFFVLAGGLAAAISVLTVSLHSVRLSLTNPVETLRYE